MKLFEKLVLTIVFTLAVVMVPVTSHAASNHAGQLKITANNHTYYGKWSDNRSARAFKEKLQSGPVVVKAHDYEHMEKVGQLPWSLQRTDRQITTKPGQVILYQGNQIVFYYRKNSWNFTSIAQVPNVSTHQLLKVLGHGKVTIQYSLAK